MNGLTAGLVLVGGLLLGFLVGRRTGFFSPSGVYIWFMDLDLALFTYIAFAHLDKSNFTFTAMPWPPFDTVVLPTVLMYAVLIVAGWLSAWNLDKATAPAAAAPKVRLVIPAFVRRNFSLLMVAFFIVVFWMEVYHFWDMDKSVFWQNSRYLSIANPTTAGINTLAGRLIHFALPPLGLVLASAGTFFWVRQRRHTAALFFILCIYPFLLALAENSRWAPLYVACVLAIIIFFESIKKYILTVIIGGVAGFLLFLKVLIGRNTPYQGLGGTAQIFALVFSEFRFWPWLISFFLNILQGAQSVANAFLISPRYPVLYKLLSFSPAISAIDHFDRVMAIGLVKITSVVPMNAYSEAYFFGAPYFLFLLLVLMIWLRTMTQLSFRRDLIGTAFMVFSYWAMFYLSQYPVRNSMRLMYISLIVGVVVIRVSSARQARLREREIPQEPGRDQAEPQT